MNRRNFGILSGPLLGVILYFFSLYEGLSVPISTLLCITAWMAIWWLSEAVDIAVTALLPFVLMPLTQILTAEQVAMQYMDQTIFLFIGGFFLAYAMEKWNLHLRIAYRILLLTGGSPARVLAGIMTAAFIISMWISNTATALMLVAAVVAIVNQNEMFTDSPKQNIPAAFLIGLAYSATLGGMATTVGTPTNMIFISFWEKQYALEAPITFLRWAKFGIPFSVTLAVCGYFILKKHFHLNAIATERSFVESKYAELGKISREQITVILFFSVTVILWFTRAGFQFGTFSIGGWEQWFGKGYIKDSTVAIFTALCLFVLPSREKNKHILEWDDVKKLPYRIILLFGGGFALAKGIEISGMGNYLAEQLRFFKDYPLWVLLAVLAVIITLLSEIASNVATITLMLPILASLAKAIEIDPLKLMVPATFAASFGFMLVIATAPNTIAFASGKFRSKDILKTGFWLNLIGIALLTLAMLVFEF
jgi:sodium-dependent dicarboxylate transporter 2/3/5